MIPATRNRHTQRHAPKAPQETQQAQEAQQQATQSLVSDLFVQILVKYGVKQIFGVPGEANPNFMLSLQKVCITVGVVLMYV